MKNLNEYLSEGLIKRQAGVDIKSKIEQLGCDIPRKVAWV